MSPEQMDPGMDAFYENRNLTMQWEVALDMAGSYVASRRYEDAENVVLAHLDMLRNQRATPTESAVENDSNEKRTP